MKFELFKRKECLVIVIGWCHLLSTYFEWAKLLKVHSVNHVEFQTCPLDQWYMQRESIKRQEEDKKRSYISWGIG